MTNDVRALIGGRCIGVWSELCSLTVPGQYPVVLKAYAKPGQTPHLFRVVYGDGADADFDNLPAALESFKSATQHAAECAGWMHQGE